MVNKTNNKNASKIEKIKEYKALLELNEKLNPLKTDGLYKIDYTTIKKQKNFVSFKEI